MGFIKWLKLENISYSKVFIRFIGQRNAQRIPKIKSKKYRFGFFFYFDGK